MKDRVRKPLKLGETPESRAHCLLSCLAAIRRSRKKQAMSNGQETKSPPEEAKAATPGTAGRSTKVKDTLQVVSMTISIVGAVGTLFVWSAANFYVGDVEVVGDRPYQNLV